MKPATETSSTRLRPKRAGEEARRRRHDRRRDDVGGQHPVDLVRARRDAALHVGQRDVGDRRVERLHDHGEDDAGGDRAAIGAGRDAPRVDGAPWLSHRRQVPQEAAAGRADARCRPS